MIFTCDQSDREVPEEWAFEAPLFDFRLRRGDKGPRRCHRHTPPVVVVLLLVNLLLLCSRQALPFPYRLFLLIIVMDKTLDDVRLLSTRPHREVAHGFSLKDHCLSPQVS